jgi:hypothetical protein
MPYKIIEPAEELVLPEYWDGIDFADEYRFLEASRAVATHDPEQNRPTELDSIDAASILKHCLDALVEGRTVEEPLSDEKEYTISPFGVDLPSTESFALIIDRERLTRTMPYKGGTPQTRLRRPLSELQNGPQIASPYSKYWLANQRGPWFGFNVGEEVAEFADPRFFYTRTLSWALVVGRNKSLDKHRAPNRIISFRFDSPKYVESATVMVSSDRAETADQLLTDNQFGSELLAVGTARPGPIVESEQGTALSINRIKQVNILRTVDRPPGSKLRLTDVIARPYRRMRASQIFGPRTLTPVS